VLQNLLDDLCILDEWRASSRRSIFIAPRGRLQYFSSDSHIAILIDRCASNRGYASRRNRAGFCARVFLKTLQNLHRFVSVQRQYLL
jgi:hypothetical protein